MVAKGKGRGAPAGARRSGARRPGARRPGAPQQEVAATTDILEMLGIGRDEITPERELVLEIGRVYHLLFRFIGEVLDRVGLTPQQYGILEILARRPDGMGQDDLRAIMVCSRPNLSGLVDRMVTARLVASRASASDRRRRTLTITAKGEAAVRRARPIYRRSLQELFAPVSPGVRSSLVALIRDLRLPLEETVESVVMSEKGTAS